MEGFNLENIKKEIEARKTESIVKGQAMGVAPKNGKKFLVDLLTSVNHGTPTPAVQALRTLSESTEQRFGLVTHAGKEIVNKGGAVQTYTPPINNTQQPIMNDNGDRGESFFDQQMAKATDMLKYKTNPQPTPNAGLSQTLSEYANAPYVGTGQQPMNESYNGGVNANMLNEHITRTMSEVMGGSNFTKLVEGAYKNMINEMYTREKVEQVLVEIIQGDTFKKILKKQIVDTLIEIQNRKKEGAK